MQQNLMKKRHFDCYKISRQVKHQIRLGQKPIVKLLQYFWQYFNRRKEQHPKTQFRFHQQQQQQREKKEMKWKEKMINDFNLRFTNNVFKIQRNKFIERIYVYSTAYLRYTTWGIHLEKGTTYLNVLCAPCPLYIFCDNEWIIMSQSKIYIRMGYYNHH